MHKELGVNEVLLEAQLYAVSLYEKCGFERISAVFLEDGIQLTHICHKNDGSQCLCTSYMGNRKLLDLHHIILSFYSLDNTCSHYRRDILLVDEFDFL